MPGQGQLIAGPGAETLLQVALLAAVCFSALYHFLAYYAYSLSFSPYAQVLVRSLFQFWV